jgi:hypothetical protein
LCAVDFEHADRLRTVEVFDGTATRSVELTDFVDGIWVEILLEVPAGGRSLCVPSATEVLTRCCPACSSA